MQFAHDTARALVGAAALINTARDGVERLDTAGALKDFVNEQEWTGRCDGTESELAAVRSLRPRLAALWASPDVDAIAAAVNALLAETGATPRLARHGEWGWHMHVTADDDPLERRMGAEAAMAILDLVRADELGRLRQCAAPDCDAVLIDLSRNKSRMYCDTGNCGNRANVAAYRARQRS